MWCHPLGQLVNVVNICIEMSMSRLIENIQLACAVCKIGIYTVSAVLRGVAKTVGSRNQSNLKCTRADERLHSRLKLINVGDNWLCI